jgi:recombination protein RecT
MSTAVAEQPKQQLTLRDRLNSEGMKKHLQMALPKHVTPERMVRVALTAMTKTPKLADCDQASFFQALFQCSQWGLEPDGRRAHLIPFENKRKGIVECQLIIDYKGLAELAFRSGMVKSIHAQEVREGDIFDFSMGQVTDHVPHAFRRDPGKPAQAGRVYAYYCIVEMAGDARKCEVMSLDEVNAIRDKSQGYSAFKKGWAKTSVWEDYPVEMGKKTVFKRASKWLPLSAEFRTAVEHDDTDYIEHHETRHTVDSISGLLANDDDVSQERPEGVSDDGEITPWNEVEIKAQFEGCSTEDEVNTLANRLIPLYQDHLPAIGGMETERKEAIREAKPKGKKSDGKFQLNP